MADKKPLTPEAQEKLDSALRKKQLGQDYTEEKNWFLRNQYGWVVHEYDL